MNRRENADITTVRQTSAGRSLGEWVKYERVRLAKERELFQEHLHGAELRQAMAENEVEQRQLDNGWRHSSLRRQIESRVGSTPSAGGVERRMVAAQSALATELRGVEDGVQIGGTAIVYNSDSVDMGYIEQMEQGSCREAVRKCDIRMLANHDPNLLLGRTSSGTLRLKEDRRGVHFACDITPGDGISGAYVRQIASRNLRECSFSFRLGKDRWELAQRRGDLDRRYIVEVDEIFDVAVVTYAAYPETHVSVVGGNRQAPSWGDTSIDEAFDKEIGRTSWTPSAADERRETRLQAIEQRLQDRKDREDLEAILAEQRVTMRLMALEQRWRNS